MSQAAAQTAPAAGTVADPAAVAGAADRKELVDRITALYSSPDDQIAAAEAMGLNPDELFANNQNLPDAPSKSPSALDEDIAKAFSQQDTFDIPDAAAAQPAAQPQDINAQLEAARAQVAELQAKAEMPSDEDFRKMAMDSLKDEVAKVAQADKEADERIKALQEEEGAEVADRVKVDIEAAKALRAQVLNSQIEARAATAKNDHAEKQRTEVETLAAVNAHPDLKQWMDDAQAAQAGTPGKDNSAYVLATSIDTALAKNPAWQGKPLVERFAEVVRMVKAASGAPAPGTPSAPATNAATAQAIRNLVGQQPASQPPQSLSAIPGSQPPSTSGLGRLNEMDANDLEAMMRRDSNPMTIEMLDRLAVQLEERDATTVS